MSNNCDDYTDASINHESWSNLNDDEILISNYIESLYLWENKSLIDKNDNIVVNDDDDDDENDDISSNFYQELDDENNTYLYCSVDGAGYFCNKYPSETLNCGHIVCPSHLTIDCIKCQNNRENAARKLQRFNKKIIFKKGLKKVKAIKIIQGFYKIIIAKKEKNRRVAKKKFLNKFNN